MIHKILTYVEFEVLTQLANKDVKPTYLLKNSLPKNLKSQFNKTLDNLFANNYLKIHQNHIRITSKGLEVLEQYKVKRAVILAAGKGERMRPETHATPKPMVKVHDKRIIETQIDALHQAGITNITIVRGYLGHIFDELLSKYSNLKFIDNPDWDKKGAIVSTHLAIDLLANAYLIEGDIYIKNPNVIRPYEYRSFYCGIPGEVAEDWHFYTDENKQIHTLAHGNTQILKGLPHKFVGIMYWSKKHVVQLKQDLQQFLQNPDNHQRFIESLPFDESTKDYNIFAKHLDKDDVTEIDTFQELQNLRNIILTV